MINVTELRIGSFLRASEKEHNGKIFGIDVGDIEEIRRGMPRYKYSPVEITAEILIKTGFTTDKNKVNYSIGLPIGHGADLFIEDEGGIPMSCGIKNFDNNFNYFKDIRYVHQLQNLYYSLSGEELDIKL